MFKFSTTLLFLLVLVLPILAKEAQYGNYTFTFFVEENCKGEINGEPMTGEVGDGAYCMNFTQGVLSMRADFANLTDKHGDAIDGVGLMYRTQKDMECGIKKNGIPAIGFYGTNDEWHCWKPTNGACHKKMADGFHYFYNGGVDSGASCHSF